MASNEDTVAVATWRDYPPADDKAKAEAKTAAPQKKES